MRHPRRLPETTKRRAMRGTISWDARSDAKSDSRSDAKSHSPIRGRLPRRTEKDCAKRCTCGRFLNADPSARFDGVFGNIPGDPAEKLTMGAAASHPQAKRMSGWGTRASAYLRMPSLVMTPL